MTKVKATLTIAGQPIEGEIELTSESSDYLTFRSNDGTLVFQLRKQLVEWRFVS